MAGLFFLRLFRRALAAAGILALAWWIMGTAPLLATAPRLANNVPQSAVNRIHKGDRLPMTGAPAVRQDLGMQSGEKPPLGCDAALGPFARTSIYGRCMA